MKFGTVATSQFSNVLSSSTNIPKLAPYWDDQATGTNGSVKYLLTGSAPNRQLVVEWFTVVPRSTTGAATARYQAVLTETTNTVQYIYGGVPAGNSYSVGLRGPGGTTDFLSVNTVTNTASTTANDSQTAAVTTGTQYAFTPPACAAPAPTVSNVTTNSAQVSFATVSGDTYTVTTSPATTSQTVSASPVTLSGLALNHDLYGKRGAQLRGRRYLVVQHRYVYHTGGSQRQPQRGHCHSDYGRLQQSCLGHLRGLDLRGRQ